MIIQAYANLNKAANTNEAVIAAMISDKPSMTDQTIKVLDIEMRDDPNGYPLCSNTEGYSFTVEISSSEKEKTVREVFVHIDDNGDFDYNASTYVHPNAEGDKFYDPMSPPQFTDEVVSDEIIESLKVASKLSPQKMKNYDLGPEARARLTARARSKVHHAPKLN